MKEKFLAVRLSQTEKIRLVKAAKKTGCSISDFVRRILWKELADSPKIEKSSERTGLGG
jgi:hypothetical protein